MRIIAIALPLVGAVLCTSCSLLDPLLNPREQVRDFIPATSATVPAIEDTIEATMRTDGNCLWIEADGADVTPIWPEGYRGRVGGMALALYRPEDPPDFA
jgi:hypothetical protein